MAEYVIPPKTAIVKCHTCNTLYVPDRTKDSKYTWSNGEFKAFEPCPVCGSENNDYSDRIPLWEYNLIKLFRGGFTKG